MEIRLLRKSEYSILRNFIDSTWKKGHALVKSKDLFNYQHLNNRGYTYYTAFDNDEIVGAIGFIPTSQFDESLIKYQDCWGAIWKVKDHSGNNGVGLDLLEILLERNAVQSFGAIGISAIAKKIYRLCGMKVAFLNHYYIVNRELKVFYIGKNLKIDIMPHVKNADWYIRRIMDLKAVKSPHPYYRPYKSLPYIVSKYENHPIYKYIFWGIYHNEHLVSIWIVRRIVVHQSSIYRIVDVLGSLLPIPNVFEQIQQILHDESCEYVDFMNYGIDENIFKSMGFCKLDLEQDEIVIPNYFEPFEQRNVKIELAYKADFEYIVFKGDSDQDRPNIL